MGKVLFKGKKKNIIKRITIKNLNKINKTY